MSWLAPCKLRRHYTRRSHAPATARALIKVIAAAACAGDAVYLQPREQDQPLYIAELLGLSEDAGGEMWANVRYGNAA